MYRIPAWAERKFLELWGSESRRAGLAAVKWDVPIHVLCSRGVDHFNVQPHGFGRRCVLERQIGISVLGNQFDPGVRRSSYGAESPGTARRAIGIGFAVQPTIALW